MMITLTDRFLPSAASAVFVAIVAILSFSARQAAAQGTTVAQDAPLLPTVIKPDDRLVRYVGRFVDVASGKSCAWPASEVSIRSDSSDLNVVLGDSTGGDEYEVFVDGLPTAVLLASAGDHVYRLLSSEKAVWHNISLIKRTETFVGVGTFEGFQLSSGGKLAAPIAHRHKIEIVGDSISCGYGDQAASQNVRFTSGTEDAAYAYGADASRALGADYCCVEWSGKKMWPDNTMGELYGRTLASDPSSSWDYSSWIPDVVLINLSTNDYGPGVPDAPGWTSGYEAFIKRLRGYYPQATIYCATSPMLNGDKAADLLKNLTQIIADEKAEGDANVRLMPIPTQDGSLGFGADWHPNIANQARSASTVIDTISKDLAWNTSPDPAGSMTQASLNALPNISLTANNGN